MSKYKIESKNVFKDGDAAPDRSFIKFSISTGNYLVRAGQVYDSRISGRGGRRCITEAYRVTDDSVNSLQKDFFVVEREKMRNLKSLKDLILPPRSRVASRGRLVPRRVPEEDTSPWRENAVRALEDR